jgi:hypothetical protein
MFVVKHNYCASTGLQYYLLFYIYNNKNPFSFITTYVLVPSNIRQIFLFHYKRVQKIRILNIFLTPMLQKFTRYHFEPAHIHVNLWVHGMDYLFSEFYLSPSFPSEREAIVNQG